MSIIGSNILAGAAGSGVSAYEIEQSLRFDGSSHLNKTLSTPTNAKTGTLSFWAKRSPSTGTHTVYQSTSNTIYTGFDNNGTGDDTYGIYLTNNSTKQVRVTTQLFRDPSAWYHIVIEVDTTQSSAADRLKLYVNGSEVTAFGTSNAVDQNDDVFSAGTYQIGSYSGSTEYYQGYLAEFHYVDGTALDPTNFGGYDDNGVWRPIRYTGTYGTNGYYLKFDPSATNGVGHDHSGNGHHWTASNVTTSGTGTDVMSDTPTNNFATLNSVYQPNDMSFSDGSLYFAPTTSNWRSAQSTIAVTGSGKYYCEMKLSNINQARICLTSIQDTDLFNVGVPSYTHNGTIVDDDLTTVATGATWTSGDVMALAIDMDNGSVGFYKNGSLQHTVTGLDTSLLWRPGVIAYTASTNGYFNFGQRAFEQTPPTGFNPISTANLPAPDIADGSDYFNTVLYTGDNTNQAITGVGFQPDWVWIKSRSSISDHVLQDAVRGAQKFLISNDTSDEDTDSGTITSFDSDGFTIGSGNSKVAANNSGETFAAWNWLAGNGTASNTDGSITSTVSANPSAGFSIVSFTGKTYTGNSSTDTGTVGHGLGVAPSFYVVKARNAASDWICYHSVLGNTKYIELNRSAAAVTQTGIWASTSPTDTVFTMGPFWPSNIADGKTMIAYCFAEVENYSRFGEYTGNGSNDGPFVYCGFKPALVITTRTDSGTDWKMWDDKRGPYNQNNNHLATNLNGSEQSDLGVDFLSNGFKLRNSGSSPNASGGAYIFMAWAENPFGGSGVSPATAR